MKEIKKRQFLAMNFCVHKITPRIGRKKCVNNNSMIVTREPQNYTPVIFPLLMRIYFFFLNQITKGPIELMFDALLFHLFHSLFSAYLTVESLNSHTIHSFSQCHRTNFANCRA